MISRSTILALLFACFATLSLAGVAEVRRNNDVERVEQAAMPIYQLPRVVVIGRTVRSIEPASTRN